MHTLKRISRILTALILATMLLPWGSGGLSRTVLAACPVTAGNWHEIGADSACAGGISNNVEASVFPSLAIAPDGMPYVAWEDSSSGDGEIYVRRWNGSSWEEVGTGSASGGGISNNSGTSGSPSLAITPDGTLYVAWADSSSGDSEIYVRRWNGSSWEEVGTDSASGGGISNNSGNSELPSLAIAPDGTPYVAWEDLSSGDYEIYVRRWNGSSWGEVGAGSTSGGGISNNSGDSYDPSVAITPDGAPYVAWHDDSGGDYEIYVRRWEGCGADGIVTEARADIGMPYNTYRGCPSAYTGCGGPYHGFYYGVCTDLAMDAYNAGVPFNLQNALYQDHRAHPGRYRYGTARNAEDLRRYFAYNQQLLLHNQVYQPGDIAFFDWTGDGLTNHVNVISEVDANGRPFKMVDATGVYQYNPSGLAFEHNWSSYYDQHVQRHGRLGAGPLTASASETQVLRIIMDSPSVTLSLRDANGKSVSSSYDENLVATNNEASIPYIPGGTYTDVGTERAITVTQPLSNTTQYFAELTGEGIATYHLRIETLQDFSVTDSQVFTQTIATGDTHGSVIALSAPGGTIEFAATSPGPSPRTNIPDSLELAGLVGASAQATFAVTEASGHQPLENVAVSATDLMDQLGGIVSGSLLTITPDSFTVPADESQDVNVQVSLADLAPGVYQGGLVITSDNGGTHMVRCVLEVQFHLVYLPITLKNY
jgi:hypothetical protein